MLICDELFRDNCLDFNILYIYNGEYQRYQNNRAKNIYLFSNSSIQTIFIKHYDIYIQGLKSKIIAVDNINFEKN